ncbi:hypothetical protein [Paenimyroides ceti]
MTDNIQESAIEIKDYIIARLKVPIFFYYLLALVLWNWDILLMILKSKFDIEDVIWYIKNHYNGSQRLWFPLLLATISSIAFPLAMVGLDWLLKFVNIARIKSAKQVSVEEAYAQYDIQSARNKTNELKSLNDLIENRNNEINDLKSKIDELNIQLQTSLDNHINLSKSLDNSKQEIQKLSNSNSYMRNLISEFHSSPLTYLDTFSLLKNNYDAKTLLDLTSKMISNNLKMKNFNVSYHELIEKMIKDKIIEKLNDQLIVTPKGILFYYYLHENSNN